MNKHLLLAAALLLSLNVAHAKKTKKATKMKKEDARELCLTTNGSDMKDKALKKCISKVMRTGKI